MPDIKSTAVAAIIGGVVLLLLTWSDTEHTHLGSFGMGALAGAIVQTGVRVCGVS